MKAQILALQVATPRSYQSPEAGDGRPGEWLSSIGKEPVAGALALSLTGLSGDGQADLKNHGGADKALLAYGAEHYETWRKVLDLPALAYGSFGENLTLAGVSETQVCLGDLWAAPGALLEVSQPRQPCWKLARYLQRPTLVAQVIQRGWSGWYLRVKKGGSLAAGQELQLQHRPYPHWTVERAMQVYLQRQDRPQEARELAACPALAESWKRGL